METQAGLYKLTLYENKSFSFLYNADGTIDFDSISNTGQVLKFETNDNRNQYSNSITTARNNDITNGHKIDFWINGLNQINLDQLERMQSTIYGWVPVMEFMDNQKYLINSPFFQNVKIFESQISHTFKLELVTRITTLKKLEEITVSTGVVGLLDFDGVDDEVVFSSIPDLTGSKTVSFKLYISSDYTISSAYEGIFSCISDTSDYLTVSIILAGSYGDCLSINTGTSVGDREHFSLTGLKDQELSVVIVKSTSSLVSLTINGVLQSNVAVGTTSSVSTEFKIGTVDLNYGTGYYIWDVSVNDEHIYSGYPNGNLNSAWIDTIGSINGTVNGNPTTIDIP